MKTHLDITVNMGNICNAGAEKEETRENTTCKAMNFDIFDRQIKTEKILDSLVTDYSLGGSYIERGAMTTSLKIGDLSSSNHSR